MLAFVVHVEPGEQNIATNSNPQRDNLRHGL